MEAAVLGYEENTRKLRDAAMQSGLIKPWYFKIRGYKENYPYIIKHLFTKKTIHEVDLFSNTLFFKQILRPPTQIIMNHFCTSIPKHSLCGSPMKTLQTLDSR